LIKIVTLLKGEDLLGQSMAVFSQGKFQLSKSSWSKSLGSSGWLLNGE
jgi:hypothetical protein